MTESRTSLCNGKKCVLCTGCGKCQEQRKPDVISTFRLAEDLCPAKAVCRQSGHAKKGYLICADIGTTTVAMQLRRMSDGAVLKTYTCENPQRRYGADVLSRIQAAEDPVKRAALKHEIREALAEGVQSLRQKLPSPALPEAGEAVRMVIAGNTTMLHLFLGYDVSGLGRYPFKPRTLAEVRTSFLGLDTLLLPGISAFVGADITADLAALAMQEREELTLLLDLGTNGEMVLGNRDRMLATATAAGPAFEGGAACFGTDLVAVCAALRKEGLLSGDGLLSEAAFSGKQGSTEGITAGGILVRQQDIRTLQLAKAAVAAGIQILCRKYGLADAGEIQRVYLAGGMGYYLDPEAAAAVGLIPLSLLYKTQAVGNAALEGAYVYGMGHPVATAGIDCLNLAEEPDFEKIFFAAMSFSYS